MKRRSRRKIRVGIVGAGRGVRISDSAKSVLEVVALCDLWEERLTSVGKRLRVETYTDFNRFLEHEFDAVILANYFHQHAPFAIKALMAGKHVMSETAACHTLAEGVALARAVEKSNRVYMFAENCPYFAYNQEMRRLYQKGAIGEFQYGEGEYIHPDPPEVKLARSCGSNHWRNWIPATYYCTHSIAPVMAITNTRPVKVNGFCVPFDFDDPSQNLAMNRGDTCSVIICRMNNGAVMKSLHGGLRGHGHFTRIHGNKGLMENVRHGDKDRLRVWREPWEKRKVEPREIVYTPDFPSHGLEANRAGHSGGDFFTSYHFSRAINTGEQPFLDVYRGIDMSIVGIQAWRSALNDSVPMEIPDFRKEPIRKQFENDHWSPDPERTGKGQPPSSILGEIKPSSDARELADKVWTARGNVESWT